jgi:hypothetical protein
MKLFLDNTKKPEEERKLEVDINMKTDGTSIKDVESKLDNIAGILEGRTQGDILKAISGETLSYVDVEVEQDDH